MSCEAKPTRAGQMRCGKCRLLWDIDDPNPPECGNAADFEPRQVDANRVTVASLAYDATRAAEAKSQEGENSKAARLVGVQLGDLAFTNGHYGRLEQVRKAHPEYNAGVVLFFAAAEMARLSFVTVTTTNHADASLRAELRAMLVQLVETVTSDNFNKGMYDGLFNQD